MANYLVFGGAFNPPTVAHINLGEYVMRAIGYDGVIYVPSKSHYIKTKQQKDYAFSDEERMEMLLRIAANRDWMRVSEIEILSPEQPRTYTTLCSLAESGDRLSLLIGSDKLAELSSNWRYVSEIAKEFGFVCMDRAGDDSEAIISADPLLRDLRQFIRLVETPESYSAISSTQVRARVKAIRDLHAELTTMLPAELNGLRKYL